MGWNIFKDTYKRGWETLIDKNFESNNYSRNTTKTTMPWEHSVEDFIGKNICVNPFTFKKEY